jgi:hypothetical protein
MMKMLIIAAVVFLATAAMAMAAEAPAAVVPGTSPNVFESPTPPAPANQIDRIVLAKLSSLKIQPVLCSDAVFVRRVYLDVIGTLPTAKEAGDFIKDPNTAGKRRALIDRLLERDEFTDYWAMKWGDVLRIKAEFPVNLWPNAAQAYHHWVRESIAANKPYDQFVREMLTSSGSNFRVPPVNFYRAIQSRTPDGIAAAVALTFMGSRIESWPKDRPQGLAAFFSQIGYKPTREWKEEHVFWDPLQSSKPPSPDGAQATPPPPTPPPAPPAAGAKAAPPPPAGEKKPATPAPAAGEKKAAPPPPAGAEAKAPPPPPPPVVGPVPAIFPDGKKILLLPNRDPREVFAEWLITPKNPWFARSAVNRVWGWLLGRGIIHEPDDIRPDNPPVNPELLAYLEKELVGARYDLKHLFRLILNSKTYQLSSIPQTKSPEAAANFAQYPLRRLEAEVLIDALDQITGTTEKYSSAIPEPFTFIPDNMRSIALPDGSISSSFLEMFGRPSRDTGLESERNNRPTADQRLHLLNSSHIQRKLEQSPKLRTLLQSKGNPREVVNGLYLTILSRFPTDDELKAVGAYSQAGGMGGTTAPTYSKGGGTGKGGAAPRTYSQGSSSKSATAAIDVAWALVNSAEFLYRH